MEREGWYRRVVPVSVLAVGLVAALALLFPAVRHQVALSASHQPQQYVELAFGRDPAGTVVTCAHAGGRDSGRVRVAFDVTSHLDATGDVRYVVTVGGHPHPGSVTLDPRETAHVTRAFDRPARRAYQVGVALPDQDREIFAHCGHRGGGGAR
ncbi:MAG TPA: hypothetical protein VFT70_17955 [Nocardioides sp.]|nr:hypothetical protein [Nocardioides sp.]